MTPQVLERFHRALIEEIQTQRPEYLTSRFTVAEIYQDLVPYGSHRDRIGVEMNGDYEDALLRLLAGEGGFLLLESEPALRDLRAELDSPNPNTSLYREFAAVDVRLNQAYLDLSAAAIDQLPDLAEELDVVDPLALVDLAPSEGSATDLGIVPPGVDIFASDVAQAAPEGESDHPGERPPLAPEFVPMIPGLESAEGSRVPADAPAADAPSATGEDGCPSCGGALPKRETVNFCPFCGTDLTVVACSGCGDELEAGWRFCPACGTEAGG